MNDLQKVELELFCVFKETCEKLNLNYFLVCGSCLGAVRHGGFIPWDDDLDVGMFRDDYNRFMEQAPALLPEGFFLQNYKTQKGWPHIFSKLRNSNTTYIEKDFAYMDINHGVFIDIFPLDGFPDDPSHIKKFMQRERLFSIKHSTVFPVHPKAKFRTRVLYKTLRLLGYHKRVGKLVAKHQAFKERYPVEKSNMIKDLGTKHKSVSIPKEYFGKGREVPFEGITARVPENTDGYLTCLYGDWKQIPPPEKQKGHHYYKICDINKPYTYYMNKKGK